MRSRGFVSIVGFCVGGAGFIPTILMAAPAHAAVVFDGSTAERAAASCWEIKQALPSSPSGQYWLGTPQLGAPDRFYCDMTTSGGGWVLVGRGRDGWMWDGNGKGTTSQVSSVVDGTGAFAPRELSDKMIDGLLGGRRLDSLTDGVRLRRALNTAGTSWQETRFAFKSRDRWSWAFGAGHPISSFTMDSASGSNTSTRTFGTDDSYRRVNTYETATNNYVRGFFFGKNGVGTTNSTSYVYSTASGQYGAPFTQVFIRPRITTADLDYDEIPDSGMDAQTALPVAENGALPASWGVTGQGAGGTGELATEAQAFAQIGNTMFVGGNFTTVQKGASATGSDKVAQPYLAAFDASTGDFISSFRPTFNKQVKALAVLPSGRLAVGGEFTTVNGSARTGLVVLDASTGVLDPLWDSTLENRTGSDVVSVRGLDTSSTHLYVAGNFTHFVRGTSTAVYARNGARLSLSTGQADGRWNPNFDGRADAVDVSSDGTRVYFAGHFLKSGTATAQNGAAVSTGTAATLISPPWTVIHSTSSSATHQQGVQEVGKLVWLGGSQHDMFGYDTGTFALKSGNITKSGGDFQAITGTKDVVYGGCHCGDWNYSGITKWDGLTSGASTVTWSQADKISLVGAWRADTGTFVTEFAPQWKSRGGFGVWGLKVADDGTLWAGGSLISAVKANGANQWVGGFARFAVRPHTAPDEPTDPQVDLEGTTATVSWTPGSSSGVTYEILRNDRVVALTSGSSATVANSAADDRFFVRASDGRGNRSESTDVTLPKASSTVLASGSTWRYLFDNTVTIDPQWNSSTFDDAGWKSGPAPLGWGTGPITTNIDVPAGETRAITSYHRTTFTAADPAFTSYQLTTRADDGLVVYINGTEVVRRNLPTGTITPTTFATASPTTAYAVANPVTATIPASLIQPGANTIAIEVHSNSRSTPSASIDASITAHTTEP